MKKKKRKKIFLFFNSLTHRFSENREAKEDSRVGSLVITKWLEGEAAEKLFLWLGLLTTVLLVWEIIARGLNKLLFFKKSMAVKGVEIGNRLSHWLWRRKCVMKNSLKTRKRLVLELEGDNYIMKLLTPSFWGFETVSWSVSFLTSLQLFPSGWWTKAEIHWQWNSWDLWKWLNLSVLHYCFIGLTAYEVV